MKEMSSDWVFEVGEMILWALGLAEFPLVVYSSEKKNLLLKLSFSYLLKNDDLGSYIHQFI